MLLLLKFVGASITLGAFVGYRFVASGLNKAGTHNKLSAFDTSPVHVYIKLIPLSKKSRKSKRINEAEFRIRGEGKARFREPQLASDR
jgi:hypothetical protein